MSDEAGPMGWIQPEIRTELQHNRHEQCLEEMPRFEISGRSEALRYGFSDEDKILLTDLWKHTAVVQENGFEFTGVHQITGSCFVADTAIRMADGSEKAIQDVCVGDEVFTHTGTKRKVVRTFKRHYTGRLHTFHVKGWRFPVTMTSDHDCLAVDGCESSKWRWRFGRFIKRKAEDVAVGNRFLLPQLNQPEENHTVDLATFCSGVTAAGVDAVRCEWRDFSWTRKRFVEFDEAVAWIVGLYLAEGSVKHNKVFFHLNPTTKAVTAAQLKSLLAATFGEDLDIREARPKPSVLQIVVHDGVFAKLIARLVPDIVYNKRLPGIILDSPVSVRLAALRGWLDGDGHFQTGLVKRGVSVRGVTASEGLARDMGQLALACGLRPSVLRRQRAKHQRIAALDVYINGADAITVYPNRREEVSISPRPKLMEKTPYGFAAVVERIDAEHVTDSPVYCCEVEEEHSLVANGVAQHQCVGAGGGNCLMTLIMIEVIRLGDPEKALIPFWLLPYGRSRYYLGDRGPGEGSTGGTFAKAMKEDGVIPANLPELPKFTNTDGLVWGQAAEMRWSDGDNPDTMRLLPEARKHVVRTVAQCRSTDEVRQAIQNGYPCTIASNWGGQMRIQPSGNPPCLLNRKAGTWNHQMSVLGWWQHPSLGELFWIQNQWGLRAHGEDPAGGPLGGFWVKQADLAFIVRQNETFAFSQHQGFPGQPNLIDWMKLFS